MTRPYRPANGIDGEIFQGSWCCRCKRDAKYQQTLDGEDGCPIIAASMVYDVGDPKYPQEMREDDSGVAYCTKFVDENDTAEQYHSDDPRQQELL